MNKPTRFRTVFISLFILLLVGCSLKTGRPFPVGPVQDIKIGVTTRADIRQVFGEPWRTGIEDGARTWTYGQYTIKNSRDLLIRFDDKGFVKSYSFSSSFPEDKTF